MLFLLSEQPPERVQGAAPGPLGNLLHVATHGLLALLVLRALVSGPGLKAPRSWPGIATRAGFRTLSLVLAHGILDEVHQFFSGRTCSVMDLLLDAGGALLVLVAPLPGAPGRPRTWWPFLTAAAASTGLAVAGWLHRPASDRALEELLKRLTS